MTYFESLTLAQLNEMFAESFCGEIVTAYLRDQDYRRGYFICLLRDDAAPTGFAACELVVTKPAAATIEFVQVQGEMLGVNF